MTFTSKLAHHTGLEEVGSSEEQLEWWNQTGAVWVVSIETEDLIMESLGLFDDVTPWPAAYSSAYNLDSSSQAFKITVPTHDCVGTYAFYARAESAQSSP